MRILVVDDALAIRRAFARFFESRGHAVAVASSTGEALRVAEDGPLELVISDAEIGAESGADLARRLRAVLPDIRLVFCTANWSFTCPQDLLGTPVVHKPCSPAEILAVATAPRRSRADSEPCSSRPVHLASAAMGATLGRDEPPAGMMQGETSAAGRAASTERRQMMEALRESEQKRRVALEAGEFGTWVYSHADGVVELDERARELYCAPSSRVVRDGAAVASRIHPDDLPLLRQRIREASDPGGDGRFVSEHRVLEEAGGVRWLGAWGQTQFEGEGAERRPVRIVGVARDFTESKRVEEELQRAKDAAEAASAAKSQFLSNMSHELRTPMNAIIGMTDLALEEQLPPRVRDLLQTSRDSADTLLELLDGLLDLARAESGRLELERTPLELRELIRKTLVPLGVSAAQKGLELVCDVLSEVPDRLEGDSTKLRQVLTNLVGNAIKFTHQGRVTVGVALVEPGEATEEEEDEITLEVSVSDTGIGISPEDQERVFTPFVQADASMTRPYGGTGLGLAISKRFVELMRGRLWLESSSSVGSTFRFTARFSPVAEP